MNTRPAIFKFRLSLPILIVLTALSGTGQAQLQLVSEKLPGFTQSSTGGGCVRQNRRARTVSDDGRYVVFVAAGDAGNPVPFDSLDPRDTNGFKDVFRHDRMTDTNELVSVNFAGTDSGNNDSGDFGNVSCDTPVISGDGRYIAFTSFASNLVATDTNGKSDVFRRDMQTGTTVLVSINSAGTDSGRNGAVGADSSDPVMTPDGRFIAFVSGARDLEGVDSSFYDDIFVRDMQIGTTTLVSMNSASTNGGNNSSAEPAISDDGRYVAFRSRATNVSPTTDTNNKEDIFRRDVQAGVTEMSSINSAGTDGGNGLSLETDQLTISADGRYVAFRSRSSDLTASTDSDTAADIFVRDHDHPTADFTQLVSINNSGTDSGNNISEDPVISADGNFVAFSSLATDLVGTDVNGYQDIFIRRINGGAPATSLVSVSTGGTQSNVWSERAAISSDGRYVAFMSAATNLGGGGSSTHDIFIRDTLAPSTTLASQDTGGSDGNANSDQVSISADGSTVMFVSAASDLVADDLNGRSDVFAFDGSVDLISARHPALPSRSGNRLSTIVQRTNQSTRLPLIPVVSADGRYVVFDSDADDLVASDTNNRRDVFLRDLQTGVTELISNDGSGGPVFGSSFPGSISRDGNIVVFESQADILGTGGSQVFAWNRTTQILTQVSLDTSNGPPQFDSFNSRVSGDGTKVLFMTRSTDVHPWATSGRYNWYVRDLNDANRATNTVLVTPSYTGGSDANASAITNWPPGISDDGRFVVFLSTATDLVDPTGLTTNTFVQAYLRDLDSSTTTMLTLNGAGEYGNRQSETVGISGNGQTAVFSSDASNLLASDTDTTEDVYAWDIGTSALSLVSENFAGTGNGNSFSFVPAVSNDGNHVVFGSRSSDLTAATTGSVDNVYIRNLTTSTTSLVSATPSGDGGNSTSYTGQVSDDGQFVVFFSNASDLVPDDTNGQGDYFLRDTINGKTVLASPSIAGVPAGVVGTANYALRHSISGDGSAAVFHTNSNDLATGDYNATVDVFAYGGCDLNLAIAPNTWTMVSLPCKPNSTVESVFGDDLGAGDYLSTWVVFERREEQDKYVQLNLASTVGQGPSYWLLSLPGGTIDVEGAATPRFCPESAAYASTGCFEVELVGHASGRQNMVGHPYTFDVNWDDVRFVDGTTEYTPTAAEGAGIAEKTFWKRNLAGNGYDAYDDDDSLPMFGTLNTFDGIWVRAFQDTTLRISANVAPAAPDEAPASAFVVPGDAIAGNGRGSGGGGAPKPPPNSDNWWVQLSVSSGDLSDVRNYLGQHEDSHSGLDSHDLEELPPFGSPYLTLHFPHPEWGADNDNFVSDFHALVPGQEDRWEFEIRSDLQSLPLSLKWSGLEDILDRSKLIDLATGEALNPGKTGEYLFELSGGVRRFAWELKGKRAK